MNITMDMTHHGHLEVNDISDGIRIAVIGGKLKVTGDIGSNVVISQRYSKPQSCLCRFFSCINPCARSYVDDRAGVDVAGRIGDGTSIMTEASVRSVSCGARVTVQSGGNVEIMSMGNNSLISAAGAIVTKYSGQCSVLNATNRISCDTLCSYASLTSKTADVIIYDAQSQAKAYAKTNLYVTNAYDKAALSASGSLVCNYTQNAILTAPQLVEGYSALPTELSVNLTGSLCRQVRSGTTTGGASYLLALGEPGGNEV